MEEETLWVLKKLSTKEISAQSADRILRALKLLTESKEDGTTVGLTTEEQRAKAETPQTVKGIVAEQQQVESATELGPEPESTVTEEAILLVEETDSSELRKLEESENALKIIPDIADIAQTVDEEAEEVEAITTKETPGESQKKEGQIPKNTVWLEPTDVETLLDDCGTCTIEDITDGTELVLERVGSTRIHGWDELHLRVEGEGRSSTVLWREKVLKIDAGNENGIELYIPPAIKKVIVGSGSGSIYIDNYSSDMVFRGPNYRGSAWSRTGRQKRKRHGTG